MRKISSGWDAAKRENQFKALIKLLSECKNVEQIEAVISTLVTSSEKAAIAQRLEIIRLIEKEETYPDIVLALGVSHNTIAAATDLYHKNGKHNIIFNKLLASFSFKPKRPKIKSTGYDPQNMNKGVGFRQMMRDQKN